MRQLHLPGVAVAVVRDGSVVTMRSYGVADLESHAPVTPDTVFELGSLTKQITAIAVMMLAEEPNLLKAIPFSATRPDSARYRTG